MTTEQKSTLIGLIISTLRFNAYMQKKHFDEARTFFALCFMPDDELNKIAKLSRVL